VTSAEPDPGPYWIGTSWKMTKTLAEARAYAERLAASAEARAVGVQSFVIPPATAIATVAAALGGTGPVLVGAQNAHWEDAGAWTGEISVPQAADAGASLIEIGHSERREHFGESDGTVNLKVGATLRHGLRPLVCVGESAGQRDAGQAVATVVGQARAALAGHEEHAARVLVAYEPVWAIGERGREPHPDEIAEVVSALTGELGPRTPVLYGGSVHRGNAESILELPCVSGLFVGRGAWDVSDFVALLGLAAGRARATGRSRR